MNVLTRSDCLSALVVVSAVITYLMQQPAPTEWAYPQWLAAAAFILSTVVAWLRTPPRDAWSDEERERNRG